MAVPIANIMESADWQDREMERLEAENAKLREEFDKMDVWHSKELSAAMAENAKLRKRVAELDELLPDNGRWYSAETVEAYVAEIAKLRKLVADMWHEGMCECGSLGKCATCMYEYPTRMRELGVEVDGGVS